MTLRAPEATLQELESLLEEGSFLETTQLCAQLLIRFPDDPEIMFIKGLAHQNINEFDMALELYSHISIHHPTYSDVWPQIAFAYFDKLDYPQALHCIQEALKKDHSNSYSWWLYGLIREHLCYIYGAQRAYVIAKELDPDTYPIPPEIDDDRLQEYLEACSKLLPPSLSVALLSLIWNFVDVPDKLHLNILGKTPLLPLLYVDNLQSQLYIYRKNVGRYTMLNEHIPSCMAQELISQLTPVKHNDA